MKIKHQNTIQFDRWQWHDVLRPIDYSSLPQTRRFSEGSYVLSGSSSRLRLLTLNGRYEWGTRLNYIPPAGQAPGLATFTVATGGVSVRRRFNADFLIAYVLHPGTAIYVGYNTNLSRPGPPVGVREMTVL